MLIGSDTEMRTGRIRKARAINRPARNDYIFDLSCLPHLRGTNGGKGCSIILGAENEAKKVFGTDSLLHKYESDSITFTLRQKRKLVLLITSVALRNSFYPRMKDYWG